MAVTCGSVFGYLVLLLLLAVAALPRIEPRISVAPNAEVGDDEREDAAETDVGGVSTEISSVKEDNIDSGQLGNEEHPSPRLETNGDQNSNSSGVPVAQGVSQMLDGSSRTTSLSQLQHPEESAATTGPDAVGQMSRAGQCPRCSKREEEQLLRVEMFKQHLLKALDLPAPPDVNGTLPKLPFDFYLGEDFSVNDDEEEGPEEAESLTPRQIFIFGDDITHKCRKQRSTGCYSFNLTSQDIDSRDVESVELWIYKQADPNDPYIQTFMVSELAAQTRDGETSLRSRGVVKRQETALKYGWMKFFVRSTVTRWLSKPQRNHGLSIVCKTCRRRSHKTIFGEKEGLKPILVFHMNPNRRLLRRIRRQTNCVEGGNNCCRKETLEINFQQIGWSYIIAPETIRADFCTGSCNGIYAAFYNHTKVLKKLENSPHNVHGTLIQPCCSPVAWRQPQSLIYRDHNDVLRKVDVPNLIVKSCGCT